MRSLLVQNIPPPQKLGDRGLRKCVADQLPKDPIDDARTCQPSNMNEDSSVVCPPSGFHWGCPDTRSQ